MSANHPTPGSTRCRHCLHHMAFSPKVEAPWCVNRACKLHGKLQRPVGQPPRGSDVYAQAKAAGLL